MHPRRTLHCTARSSSTKCSRRHSKMKGVRPISVLFILCMLSVVLAVFAEDSQSVAVQDPIAIKDSFDTLDTSARQRRTCNGRGCGCKSGRCWNSKSCGRGRWCWSRSINSRHCKKCTYHHQCYRNFPCCQRCQG